MSDFHVGLFLGWLIANLMNLAFCNLFPPKGPRHRVKDPPWEECEWEERERDL